ncbi:MAG: alpha/beta hydrolase [Luteolibacter sp.]|uniref:esterase/lipase family protein n=1 Tax=Luteolibacter sp. TaxID=1962973 RepID=UPI003262ED8B
MTRFFSVLLIGVSLGTLPACRVTSLVSGYREAQVSDVAENLEQARLAWNIMAEKSPRSFAARQARERYDRAVVTVVKSLRAKEGTDIWGKAIPLEGKHPWSITFDAPAQGAMARTFSLTEFNRCQLADDVKLSGFDQVVARDGIGVPVVLQQDDARRVAQPFHPPTGEFLPATAVLEFPAVASGRPAEARLRFYNPMVVSEVSVGGSSRRMAENLTAPLQLSLTNADADDTGIAALKPSASGEQESQLFLLNRYDPSKVPVVYVHGLLCGPDVWKNSVNAMLADPDLRKRYQPVCFKYPSSLPIPTTAARLRELLKSARDTLDPGHRDAGFGRIVLVGHSMGGLVSRMQTIDSGDDFWKAYFTASPQKVSRKIDSQTRQMLMGSLFFKREPDVKLVVFIGTPHRGSKLADVGFYRAAIDLILFLPKTAKKGLEELAALPLTFVQPELRSFSDHGVGGTENLSTKHPFFEALEKRPIGVPFHTIIATRGQFDFKHGSDGIVPYSSAHLDGAVSEVIVPYPHGCLERPATVNAVTKILKAN